MTVKANRRLRALLTGGTVIATLGAAGVVALLHSQSALAATARQVERLDRGLISVRTGSNNLVSWRLLGTDPSGVSFNVYRGSTKVNSSPITNSTNYLDSGAAAG
ncbi:MAG: rhamnogalacturonan lyase, partial [Micromonosporaceae bacterium]|nr:rhamnogalacturonan lyase [Micromonosporaceae bacterium]